MIKVLALLGMMTATASAAEPQWCKGPPKDRDEGWAETAENSLVDYRGSHHSQYRLFEAARVVCNAPRSAQAKKIATEIVTSWMRETGLDEAHAQESIAVRVDKDAWDADKEKLCEAMPEEGHLNDAKKRLFGCTGDTLWLQPMNDVDLEEEIDRGPAWHDDLAHLAWMLHRAAKDLDSTDKRALVGYAVDQVDFRILPTDAVMHELDVAPFKGSRVAHVILMESLASLRQQVARVEKAVAAKDASWREIVVTGPAEAARQWDEAAHKYQEQLAHFDAKPVAGCAKKLRAELAAIMKPLDHHSLDGALDAISDHPLAGYFLARYAKCAIKEDDVQLGQTVGVLAHAVRQKPGPHWAAYYGAIDAIARIGEDAPVQAHDLLLLDHHHEGGSRGNWDNLGTNGVIAGVGGGKVTFVQKKVQVMDQECHETNKIDRVLPDGKVEYRRVCKDKGMVWTTEGPRPVILDTRFTDQIKVGRYARFDDDLGSKPACPLYVYADAKKSRLIAIGTFLLQ